MIIKKSSLYLLGIVLLIVIAGFFFFSDGKITGNVINSVSAQASGESGEVQVAKLSVSGGTYVLSPNTFKVGIPVRLQADISQMPGCSKSIVIPAFNVRKIVSSGDNVIEFTPDKAGIFNIACSMNMYKGTFTVTDTSGKASNYVEPVKAGGSCGSGSGGCCFGGF